MPRSTAILRDLDELPHRAVFLASQHRAIRDRRALLRGRILPLESDAAALGELYLLDLLLRTADCQRVLRDPHLLPARRAPVVIEEAGSLAACDVSPVLEASPR